VTGSDFGAAFRRGLHTPGVALTGGGRKRGCAVETVSTHRPPDATDWHNDTGLRGARRR